MAQVTSGTIKSSDYNYTHFYLSWQQVSQDIANNQTTINWQVGIQATRGAYWYSNAVKVYSVYIAGTKVSSGGTWSNKYLTSGNNYTIQLLSGTATIPHATDGTKTFTASMSGWLYDSFTANISDNFELKQIPRYLTINSFSISNITETSVVVNWSVSDPRTSTYYSFDGGTNWIGSATDGESLASDNKSGSFNIKNLSANKTYNIKIKIKRTDSGLWTESDTKSFTTYNYPYCTETPNFTIGNALTLKVYNPLNRTFNFKIIGANGVSLAESNYSGTTISGFNNTTWQNFWYSTIPNAKSGQYKVQIIYGSSTKEKAGGTCSIKGNETPTVGSITYADTNTTITAITGNNQHIVQNQSNLKVTYTKATGKNSASISKYTFTLNGVTKESTSAGGTVDFGKVNSANNLTLTMVVTDSRGLTSSATKTITMLEHSNPNAIVTLNRLNNYEDETYLTVDGSISSVNSKNTMEIKYRYKENGGSYGEFTTIEDNVKQTLSLDKNNIYIFNVVITDRFGATYDKEHTLNKGVFPLFIDIEKNSVGINCFPTKDKSFEVNGLDVFDISKNLNNSIKGILLGSSAGLTISINSFGSTDKIPIIVAGADNSSMTPVFTIIHIRSESGFGYKSLGLDSQITRDGNRVHINASQWSYFMVIAPLGVEISLSNSAL